MRGKDAAQAHFSATLDGVRKARLWLQQWLRDRDCPARAVDAFAVSLAELGTNIVQHSDAPPGSFQVRLALSAGQPSMELAAEGHSFDAPEEFQALLQGEVEDVLSESGRGLVMVGRFFPDAEYRPPNGDGMEHFLLRCAAECAGAGSQVRL